MYYSGSDIKMTRFFTNIKDFLASYRHGYRYLEINRALIPMLDFKLVYDITQLILLNHKM